MPARVNENLARPGCFSELSDTVAAVAAAGATRETKHQQTSDHGKDYNQREQGSRRASGRASGDGRDMEAQGNTRESDSRGVRAHDRV